MLKSNEYVKIPILYSKKNKKQVMHRKRTNELIFYCLMLIIPLSQFLIFYVGVNLNSVLLAFEKYDIVLQKYSFYGFNNFIMVINDLFNDPMLKSCFFNSLILFLTQVLVIMPLTLFFSFYIYKKMPLSGAFKIVLFLPSVISSIVFIMVFKYFTQDALSQLFKPLGISFKMVFRTPGSAYNALMIYTVWMSFGSGLVLYTGAMSRVPQAVVEAVKIDGGSMFQEFLHITLPLVYSTFSIFLATSLIIFFNGSPSTFAFYKQEAPDHVYTYGYYFFVKVLNSTSEIDYPYAAAGGLVFTAIVAPITLFLRNFMEKHDPIN